MGYGGEEALSAEEAAEDARLRALSDKIEQTRWGKYVHTSEVKTKPIELVHIAQGGGGEGLIDREFNPGIYTGSDALQKALGGFQRGRLYILAGRPGMGKSTAATCWPMRTAMRGFKVVFFSLEMHHEELLARCLSDLTYTPHGAMAAPYNKILAGETAHAQKLKLREAWERLSELDFRVNTKMGISLSQLRENVDWLGNTVDLLVVDHLGLLKASDRYSGNKVAEVGEISAGLKEIAKEYDVAVLALCQLNRAVEARKDEGNRPRLSDLRDSGNIEQDADVVMLMYREAYYLEQKAGHDEALKTLAQQSRHDLELIIAKNRSGPTPTIDYFCEIGCAHISDKRGTGDDASTLVMGQAKADRSGR